jgi:hypothetical protein
MGYELCKFGLGPPQKKNIFFHIEIPTAYVTHSDSNLDEVHCFWPGYAEPLSVSWEKIV